MSELESDPDYVDEVLYWTGVDLLADSSPEVSDEWDDWEVDDET